MKKHFLLFLLLAAGISSSAQAGLISGTYNLSNGKSVDLQGMEWMPLTYTAGLSRNDVEDGFTDAFGSTWAAGDWRYATRLETARLLGSLWSAGQDGASNENYLGAKWFMDTFGELYSDPKGYDYGLRGLGYSRFAYGKAGECSSDLSKTCEGMVFVGLDSGQPLFTYIDLFTGKRETPDHTRPIGYFESTDGLNATPWVTPDTRNSSTRFSTSGSLLVRFEPHLEKPHKIGVGKAVPEPSALGLLALGLGGLLFRRRKASQ